jgi:hypothetical protein
MANPSEEHVMAAKHVLRYLKGTAACGLKLGYCPEACLSGYSDSDHAGDSNDRKSISGYAVLYGHGAVIWSSKKQNCVSVSSTEAEYVAASEATMDLAWVRQLLADLQKPPGGPTKLYIDNESAVKLAVNPVFHSRTKHIDVRYHFIRDMVEKKQIDPARVDVGAKSNFASVCYLHLPWEFHLQIYLHLKFPVVSFLFCLCVTLLHFVCWCRLNSECGEQGRNCGATTFVVYTFVVYTFVVVVTETCSESPCSPKQHLGLQVIGGCFT